MNNKIDMTLNEAIEHCYEVANSTPCNESQKKCNAEHLQLAKWLEELREYRLRDNPIQKQLQMNVGSFINSGRYAEIESIKELNYFLNCFDGEVVATIKNRAGVFEGMIGYAEQRNGEPIKITLEFKTER